MTHRKRSGTGRRPKAAQRTRSRRRTVANLKAAGKRRVDLTARRRREQTQRKREERRKITEAIQAERQRFNEVLRILPAYVVLLTPDYHVPFANRFFEERFGKADGRRCYEYLFHRSEPCEVCDTYTVLKTKSPHRWEWAGPDGRNYDIYDFPFTDVDGSPLIMEVGIDITEVKRAQAALKEANETLEQRVAERTAALRASLDRYHSFLEVTGQVGWTTDPNGEVAEDLPAWRRFTGQTVEEIMGWRWSQALHPDDRQRTAEVWRAAVATRTGYETEYRLRRHDGVYRDFLARGVPVLDEHGGVREWVGTCIDITERKQAEDRAASLARFPAENPSPVLRVARDLTLVYANASAEPLLRAWECRVGQPVPDLIGRNVTAALESRDRREVEISAEGRIFSIILSPVAEAGYVNMYGRDVTERLRTEESLRQVALELARSNEDLEQFAYVASHDLQEPLRAVSSFVQLLQRQYQGKLDAKADEYIRFIVDGVARMQALIKDLLVYSRVGRRGDTRAAVDVDQILQTVMADLADPIEQSGALVTHDSMPTVRANAGQLAQLFQNLLGNAIKFRRADVRPEIHVGATRRSDGWLFSVRDNGIGIPAQHLERVFLIFQRLHTRDEYAGTGIGLAICKRIVDHHGGRIWVESSPGQGSTFQFTIPDPPSTGLSGL